MRFENLDQLKTTFLEGNLILPEDVEVAGVVFKQRVSSSYRLDEMLAGKRAVVVYHAPESVDALKAASLNEWLVFVWSPTTKQQIVPAGVVNIAPRVVSLEEAMGDKPRTLRPGDVIGDVVQVKFSGIGGNTLKGKVDTGAEISSLHADNWNIRGNKVEFICPALSSNTIVLPLLDQQAVKSASGIQYRPVVELTVKVNDRVINGAQFNLADRKHMDYPVLVGQNVLSRGKFLIDPSMNEEVDWDYLQQETQSILVEDASPTTQSIEEVYQILKNNKVSFGDLIRRIRTEVTQTFENVKY